LLSLPPLAAHAVELVALLALTLLSAAAGDALLDRLGLRKEFGIESGVSSPPAIFERLIFSVALGYGSLAYLTFAIGLAGVLYGPLMASLLLVCGIGLRRRLGTSARRASILVRSLGRAVQDPLILVLASVSASRSAWP
jgi:hypothetical protein